MQAGMAYIDVDPGCLSEIFEVRADSCKSQAFLNRIRGAENGNALKHPKMCGCNVLINALAALEAAVLQTLFAALHRCYCGCPRS